VSSADRRAPAASSSALTRHSLRVGCPGAAARRRILGGSPARARRAEASGYRGARPLRHASCSRPSPGGRPPTRTPHCPLPRTQVRRRGDPGFFDSHRDWKTLNFPSFLG
jgi:hypothetical protein